MKIGDKYSQSFVVTPDVYEGFLSSFNDRNPLHTNADFARAYGFENKVMHGNILNGFVSYFVGECLPVKNVAIQSQSINYALPVYLGDQLEFTADIKDFFDSVQAYFFEFSFRNQKGKKVARGEVQVGLLRENR